MASAQEIMGVVEADERLTAQLRNRMRNDHLLYTLDPFRWRQLGVETERQAKITAPAPRVLAHTMMALLGMARMTYRAPIESHSEEEGNAGRAAEQLFTGFMQQSDGENTRMGRMLTREHLVENLVVRGFGVLLHRLVQDRQTLQARAVIEAWDPLNTHWGMDRNGLAWAAYKQYFTADELDASWGGRGASRRSAAKTVLPEGVGNRASSLYKVIDYYDRKENVLVVDGEVRRRVPMRSTGGEVPVTVVAVGGQLMRDADTGVVDYFNWGQSIYDENRQMWPVYYGILSTKWERLLRVNNPATISHAEGGEDWVSRVNPEIQSPYERGIRLFANSATGESIEPVKQPEMPRDLLELEASVVGEIQRSGLPHLLHGQSGGQVSSGYNTSLLLGTSDIKTRPFHQAMLRIYQRVEQSLRSQFMSGYFGPVRMRGRVGQYAPFNNLIGPEQVAGAPELVFEMKPDNLSDVAQRMSVVAGMRSGDPPLIDDETLLDWSGLVDDPSFTLEKVRLQEARRQLPMARMLYDMKAAIAAGDMELANALAVGLEQMMLPGAAPQTPAALPSGRGGGGISGGPLGMLRQGGGGGGGASVRGLETEFGGSPRGGMPNPSDERQLGGRPRPPGMR